MSKPIDVHRRIVWGKHKVHRARLIYWLVGVVACAGVVWLADQPHERLLAGAGAAFLIPMSIYEIYRLYRPGEPLVELHPEGLIFRQTTNDFIIPWPEIRGIDTITIHGQFRGRPVVFPDVTVVLVSNFFYDRVIHEHSFFTRGPFWEHVFVPKGKYVQIALHHEALPATAEEIKREVTARWQAFGRKAPVPAKAAPAKPAAQA